MNLLIRWLIFVLILSWSSVAMAQDLETALDLERSGRLIDALDAFEEALRSSGNSRRDLATIYQHLSVLRFASGDELGANDALMRLLAVSPAATLPDSAPPEIQSMLEEAAGRWEGSTLRAQVRHRVREEELLLRVTVVDDLAGMVAGVELMANSRVVAESEDIGPEFRLRVDHNELGGVDELTVLLVDEYHGILWEGTHTIEPSELDHEQQESTLPPDVSSSSWQRSVAWTLVSVGLATLLAGAITTGVHDTSTGEQQVLDGIIYEKYRDTLSGGIALLSIGGALTLGGVIWLFARRLSHRPSSEESTAAFHLSSW